MTRDRGFTVVELLLVLLLLAGLSAVVVPQYFDLGAESRESALVTDLQALREAVERYQQEHDGRLPGFLDGTYSETSFVRQLSRSSLVDGVVDPAGTFGPYLPAGIPANPFNELSTVWIATEETLPGPNDSTGWIFHPATGTVRTNSTGRGSSGVALADL